MPAVGIPSAINCASWCNIAANVEIPARFTGAIEELHQQAVTAAGLEDFGDTSYREALQILLESYDTSANLSELGRYQAWFTLLNCLRGRLLAIAGISAGHLQPSIAKPLFIVGLPRTGTTVLHRLLASQPNHQALEHWLGSFPQPRPPRRQWAGHEHFQEVSRALAQLDEMHPEFKKIHEMSAGAADECRLLLMQSFVNVSFQSSACINEYEQWLYEADLRPAYALYRDSLRLIGSREPQRRWILKDPSHLWAMDVLLETFPDAMVIQIHRDPVQLISSVSSLVLSARRMLDPEVNPEVVARRELRQWKKVWDKTLAVRKQHPQRFIDVYFSDFMQDPVAVVGEIYRQLGESLDAREDRRMRRWMREHPLGKHGGHSYSAQEFGLSERDIRAAFAQYCEFFRV